MNLLKCNAYISCKEKFLNRKIRRKRSQQSSSSWREFSAHNNETENDNDYLQSSDRRSAGLDDRDKLCKRSVADLG
jgi:hypothetical protein